MFCAEQNNNYHIKTFKMAPTPCFSFHKFSPSSLRFTVSVCTPDAPTTHLYMLSFGPGLASK